MRTAGHNIARYKLSVWSGSNGDDSAREVATDYGAGGGKCCAHLVVARIDSYGGRLKITRTVPGSNGGMPISVRSGFPSEFCMMARREEGEVGSGDMAIRTVCSNIGNCVLN